MKYNYGTGSLENWLVMEENFSPLIQGKCEAIFTQGNGYLGLRNATEESYIGQLRNLAIAGTFNKFDASEVTELPNAADITALDIRIDGQRFSLEQGSYSEYQRVLNLKTGEVRRTFKWMSVLGKEIKFTLKRFVSKANRHLIGMAFEIEPLDADIDISIQSGINAQQTNTGTQHFSEGVKRVYDKKYVQLVQTTTESAIDFVFSTTHTVHNDGIPIEMHRMQIDRRAISVIYTGKVQKKTTFSGEKLTCVYTSRDNDVEEGIKLDALQKFSLEQLKEISKKGYNGHLIVSASEWGKYWELHDVQVTSTNAFDQLALRFALYHLSILTPSHDARMGVAAKGLSGQGYKGHSFWDTEVFVFPYWMFTDPTVAKSLIEYRYQTIGSAFKKAKENGYEGAMYPWESAWQDDGETTPLWGAVDIITGKATKIWSGLIEIHITADIANALWQYYTMTEDYDFMERAGFEIIFQTALFWTSRLEWNDEKKQYEITDVVGADEYKEHVDNNAMTNYLAYHNMEIALTCYKELQEEHPEAFEKLEAELEISKIVTRIESMLPKFYRPLPRKEDLLIAQDDTYLTLQEIDLAPYKSQQQVGSMFHDYNLEQVNKIQVSKQSDVVMVLYLLEELFTEEEKRANFIYYEQRTLHDSSLSLSTHAIVGNDLGAYEMAYSLFQKATEIDLGPNMKTSDDGIHAAAMGGIWQSAINGFGGVRLVGDKLRIEPRLPEEWTELHFSIIWKSQPLVLTITREKMTIQHKGEHSVEILHKGNDITIQQGTSIELKI